MSATATIPSNREAGHELMDGEDAAMMIAGLRNRVSITLEGVEIVRGTHESLGALTFIVPVAGQTALLYPFDFNSDFCYKSL